MQFLLVSQNAGNNFFFFLFFSHFFSPDSSESTVGFVHSTLLCQMIKEKCILHEGLIQNEKSVIINFCVLHIFADTALFVVDHEQLLSSSKK